MEAPTTTTTTTTTSSSHVEGFIPPFKSLQKRLSKCGIDLERDFQILELLQKEKERQEGDCGGAKSGVRPPSICCPPSSKPKSAPCAPTSPPTSPVQEAAGPCLSPVASPATSSPPPLPPTAAAPEHREAVVCCICLDGIAEEELFELDCSHQMCRGCLEGYYSLEVSEGRTHVTCPLPDCAREVGAAKVQELLSEELFDKFTRFSLKKALKADPHSHFCPAPDCDYAILIKPRKSKGLLGLGRKRCTKPEDQQHVCGNPACRTSFCLQCGDVWHPALTCEENRSLKATLGGQLVDTDNVKPCPKCSVPIFKLQDGSCNHMKCAMCETEFCWICMKEVNDLHYFSPSGCTFYAEKPWSMKKKMAFRTTIAVTAPAIIGAAAVASVPAVLIGFPVKVGQKLSRRFKHQPLKRALALGAGVPGAILASPLVAAAAIAVGVPALLIGTYVVFPVYLYKEHTKNKKIQLEKKLANSTIMLDLNVDPDLIAE